MKYYVIKRLGCNELLEPKDVNVFDTLEEAETYAEKEYRKALESGNYAERGIFPTTSHGRITSSHATTTTQYITALRANTTAPEVSWRVIAVPVPAALNEIGLTLEPSEYER